MFPELMRAVMFMAGVAAVYVAAGVLGIKYWLRRFRRQATTAKQGEVLLRRTLYAIGVVGLLCLAYSYFVEPYWLDMSHVRIVSAKLADATRPIKLVQISDLHTEEKARLEDLLPSLIARERPDVIVFTGDAINSNQGLPVFKRCLSRLAAIAPTFVVRGNWDESQGMRKLDLFGATGARELDGETAGVKVAGAELWLAGAGMNHMKSLREVLERIPSGVFTIFLYHSPDEIPEVSQRSVDLYLAGDTHGGQVALPLYGALATESRFGKTFEAGLYRVSGTWLYVNRGIGMTADFPLPVRFCARPEVTVIELVPLRPNQFLLSTAPFLRDLSTCSGHKELRLLLSRQTRRNLLRRRRDLLGSKVEISHTTRVAK